MSDTPHRKDLHARPQPSRAVAFGVPSARRPRARTPRRSGILLAPMVTDIDAWFAEFGRFANLPFMEEGRQQRPMPAAEDLTTC